MSSPPSPILKHVLPSNSLKRWCTFTASLPVTDWLGWVLHKGASVGDFTSLALWISRDFACTLCCTVVMYSLVIQSLLLTLSQPQWRFSVICMWHLNLNYSLNAWCDSIPQLPAFCVHITILCHGIHRALWVHEPALIFYSLPRLWLIKIHTILLLVLPACWASLLLSPFPFNN